MPAVIPAVDGDRSGSFAGVVVMSDADGEGVLDATPGIDPSSLAIAAARVY